MLWTPEKHYSNDPFEAESQLECAIDQVSAPLFGPNRIYLDVKKLIGGVLAEPPPNGIPLNTEVAPWQT